MTDHTAVAERPVVAGLTRSQLLDIYYYLGLTRATEERLMVLYRQGHIHGGLYRSLGQEGEAVATAYSLRPRPDGTGDVVGHLTRNLGSMFVFGFTPLELMRQYLARGTALTGGRDNVLHVTDLARGFVGPVSPLGTQVEVLAGIALAFRIRGEDRVALVYQGEGATSTGQFHEGLNLAAVQRCPLIVIVEVNQYAFSTPTSQQTRAKHFVDKAPGYGIAGERVDGNDVIAVYEAAKRAVDRARAGEGVTLLEVETFRRLGHAQHDAQDYVPREVIEHWEQRDPIDLYRRRLLAEGWATAANVEGMQQRCEREAREAADQALAEPYPDPEFAARDVYTDVPVRRPWTRLDPPDPRVDELVG
ncbi:MAG: thiamine pyrophosphate-dependent dehydrogenase E1 component subunit alpha [Gemmatimonadetes bacterium]|nr:thiamine pyrophosphate-dependent dehydrogenase E1 component subunit alpha [Gemmatimonadota bacterium]